MKLLSNRKLSEKPQGNAREMCFFLIKKKNAMQYKNARASSVNGH